VQCSHKDPDHLGKRRFAHRAELLAAAHPGKPWAYYRFEHPELRPAAADDEDVPDDQPQLGTVWPVVARGDGGAMW
jgi:hypothetical protein